MKNHFFPDHNLIKQAKLSLTVKEKIKAISKLSTAPEAMEEILLYLSNSLNFECFLGKLKKKLKEKDADVLSEIICAYRLKKHAGFTIGFLPEKQEHICARGDALPAAQVPGNYNELKKPDIWIVGEEWFFVDAKRIGPISKSKILRMAYDSSFNHEKETAITSSRIVGSVKRGFEQVKVFGRGFVYVECSRGKIDIDKIKVKLKEVFNSEENLRGVVIAYNILDIDNYKLIPSVKVLLRKDVL